MKEGWRYEKLDDLGTIVTGATPSTNDESNYFPKEYCFVKPSDLPLNGVGSIHETENYVSSKGLSVSRPLPAGSVLTTCIGTIGKVGLLLQEGCTNQQINAVIPNNKINSRYLAYALLSIRKQLEFIANAPVVPIINKKCFSKIHIGYPPKPTQLSIVSELDKLNELIRIKKEQLKDYDTLAQSIFYEMFGDPVENEKGWEVKKLKDISRKIGDGLHGTPEYSELDTGWYFINGNNLENGCISIKSTTKKVTDFVRKKYYVEMDDFTLLVSINGTLGKSAFYNGENVILGKSACYIKLNKDVNKLFIYEIIRGEYFKRYAESVCTGTTIRNVSLKAMREFPIIYPPLPLQHSFAQKIEQIEQQKAAIQKTITDLETLLAARMQYWFD